MKTYQAVTIALWLIAIASLWTAASAALHTATTRHELLATRSALADRVAERAELLERHQRLELALAARARTVDLAARARALGLVEARETNYVVVSPGTRTIARRDDAQPVSAGRSLTR